MPNSSWTPIRTACPAYPGDRLEARPFGIDSLVANRFAWRHSVLSTPSAPPRATSESHDQLESLQPLRPPHTSPRSRADGATRLTELGAEELILLIGFRHSLALSVHLNSHFPSALATMNNASYVECTGGRRALYPMRPRKGGHYGGPHNGMPRRPSFGSLPPFLRNGFSTVPQFFFLRPVRSLTL